MEIILLGIYAFFVWLIFFKFKWLPWNFTSQFIVITLPIVAMMALFLLLNISAPATDDVRAMNYVIPIVPRITGQVTEVPIQPNRPIKKGDVLFKIDPVPFEAAVKAAEATLRDADRSLVEEGEQRTQLLAPRVRRQHLVRAVREDDQPHAPLGLREGLQDALHALRLLRVDARREVEDDDAAAPGREVAGTIRPPQDRTASTGRNSGSRPILARDRAR